MRYKVYYWLAVRIGNFFIFEIEPLYVTQTEVAVITVTSELPPDHRDPKSSCVFK